MNYVFTCLVDSKKFKSKKSEVYSELCRGAKREHFRKIVNDF